MRDFWDLGQFRLFLKGRKNVKLLECEQIIYHFKTRDLEILNIYNLFREIFEFRTYFREIQIFPCNIPPANVFIHPAYFFQI